jgi:hypothetical protein
VLLRLVVRLVEGLLVVDLLLVLVLRVGHAEARRGVGGRGKLVGRRGGRRRVALLVLVLGVHGVVDLLFERVNKGRGTLVEAQFGLLLRRTEIGRERERGNGEEEREGRRTGERGARRGV